MSKKETILEHLTRQGVSRRSFLKFCAVTSSMLALPPGTERLMAQTLATTPRPTVIWLSAQECTGCSESFLRSFDPAIESLILDHLSLDYHNTLLAPSGEAAEAARIQAMNDAFGQYVLVVDGAIPAREGGAWSTIGGRSAIQLVQECVEGAALVIAVGTCATFGGIPAANPNPGMATGVGELMDQGLIANRPLINVSGCPPVPEVITGVVAHYLVFGTVPELDELRRPKVFYGKTVHDCCPRLEHYDRGEFALTFDDEGARNGHCLLLLGCKGPTTFNACTTVKWNQGTSNPMHSGHGCLGCSEPGFWDKEGFYEFRNPPATPIGDTAAPCTVPQNPLNAL